MTARHQAACTAHSRERAFLAAGLCACQQNHPSGKLIQQVYACRRDPADPSNEVVAAEPQTVTLSQPDFWCAADSTAKGTREQAWFGGLAEVLIPC